MRDQLKKTKTSIKITEVFSNNKTLEELLLKLLLSQQPIVIPETVKPST